MRWGLSWILAQLEPPLLLLWNELRLKLNLGSARASFIISLKLDEARAESWLSSSLHYYYFEMRWGSSWILAQLEPLLLLLSNEMRLELNIGSARASFIISLKLDDARAEPWLSSSPHYYYFEMRWGSSWILGQLEPLLLLLQWDEARAESWLISSLLYY
jgi:hypothetical protein